MAQIRPILVVSGGRGFGKLPHERAVVRGDLAALRQLPGGGPEALAHGGADGLDTVAAEEAARLGYHVLPPWLPETNPSTGRWVDNGAGLRRNVTMLRESHARALMAWPASWGSGTWHCAANAARLGIPAIVTMPWARPSTVAQLTREGVRHHLSRGYRDRLRLYCSGCRVGLVVDPAENRRTEDTLDTLAGLFGDDARVDDAVAFLLAHLPQITGT